MRKSEFMRGATELKEIVNFIKIHHLKQGKKPPSTREITKEIAKKINKEELLYEKFIQL